MRNFVYGQTDGAGGTRTRASPNKRKQQNEIQNQCLSAAD